MQYVGLDSIPSLGGSPLRDLEASKSTPWSFGSSSKSWHSKRTRHSAKLAAHNLLQTSRSHIRQRTASTSCTTDTSSQHILSPPSPRRSKTPLSQTMHKTRPMSLDIDAAASLPSPPATKIPPTPLPCDQDSHNVQNKSGDADTFDPHIDAFEILRERINGITRAMQALHVDELYEERDEPPLEYHQRYHTEPGCHTEFYAAIPDNALHKDHHDRDAPMSRSSVCGSVPLTPYSGHSCLTSTEDDETNVMPIVDVKENNPWSGLCTNEDFERDMAMLQSNHSTSPTMATLFSTTNTLIQSRLGETSWSMNSADDDESPSSTQWRQQFLSLATSCIDHSEQLESLSTELLGTEVRVRELLSLEKTVNEQFLEREKAYEERIRECEMVSVQQKVMVESLGDLMADLDMKLAQLYRQQLDPLPFSAPTGSETNRWDFRRSVGDIVSLEEKDDFLHKLRWEVGMFIGGGVGTGHVIHTFEGRLNGIDMIIAGSGTTMENAYRDEEVCQPRESTAVSPTLRHATFYKHQFVLHIRPQDRHSRFPLLPRRHWIPDASTGRCQYVGQSFSGRSCSTHFTFFQRRHHCRRCGIVVCQRHSTNKLPLFPPHSQPHETNARWCRVCDTCFLELITVSPDDME